MAGYCGGHPPPGMHMRTAKPLGLALAMTLPGIAIGGGAPAELPLSASVARLDHAVRGASMGETLGWAGDLNGDGLDDLMIGAPRARGRAGEVLLAVGPWTGPRAMPSSAYASIVGDAPGHHLGVAIGPAGDVNGDGHADVWVADEATAYLFHGPLSGEITTADAAATVRYRGKLGYSRLVSGRDLTGDGVADLLLAGRDRVHLVEGPFSGHGHADEVARLTMYHSACDVFGQILDELGDADGDGYAELLVGAAGSAACTSTGQLAVVPASIEGIVDITRHDRISVLSGLVYAGVAAGDVDGDGVGDLVLGQVHKAELITVAGPFLESRQVGKGDDWARRTSGGKGLGVQLAATGDLDGDGRGDMLAASIEAGYVGGVYWISGALEAGDLDSTSVKLVTEAMSHADRMALLAGRDLDGDGTNDVVVGVPGRSDGSGGAVYVVSGAALAARVEVL
jgi:hypothetical protein